MFNYFLLSRDCKRLINKGDYVSFDLADTTLCKVIDYTKKYVLISDGLCTYWERREFIVHIYRIQILNDGLRSYLEKEGIL